MMAVLCGSALAEWSSDPSQNLLVFGGAGDQLQPKVVLDGGGNTWVSCFSLELVGGDTLHRVRLQKLDLLGHSLFPSGGVMLGEHPVMGWYSDYDMMTDASGNVFVCYAASGEGGASSIFATLAAPDGSLLWGSAGVEVFSDASTEAYSPRAIRTPDGGYVIVWTCETSGNPAFLRMQKLDGEGTPLWGEGIDLTGPSGRDLDWAWFTPSGEGFLLSWVERYTSGSELSVYGAVNRFDQDGNPLWAAPVEYSSDGSMFEFMFPQAVPDGEEGVFLAWEAYTGRGMKTSRIQHVTSDGASTMEAGGTPVSTATGNSHRGPAMAFLPSDQDLRTFWVEWNDSSSDQGIYGQRFSTEGEPTWPDTGLALIPLVDNTYFGLTTRLATGSDVLCVYGYKPDGAPFGMIKAMLTAQDGSQVWADWPVVINDTAKDKGLLVVTDLCWGQEWILVWEEIRGGDPDIYAQNLKLDGTLGAGGLGVGEAETPEGTIRLLGSFPNPCSGSFTARFLAGCSMEVTLEIYDTAGRRIGETGLGSVSPGENAVSVDFPELSSGLYLYRITGEGSAATGRLMILR